jgi:hypothetical protein
LGLPLPRFIDAQLRLAVTPLAGPHDTRERISAQVPLPDGPVQEGLRFRKDVPV